MQPVAAASIDVTGALTEGRRLVAYYNCRGCHRIDGQGGIIADYIERKSFAPPTLEGEGARVQTSWLVDYLQQPRSLRPWLGIHMPDFGLTPAEAQMLATYFAVLASVQAADEPPKSASSELATLGERRFVRHKCIQCHVAVTGAAIPAGIDPEDLSIDLRLTKVRLRPSWIRKFLAHPKTVVGTATRMPAVFYDSDGDPKVDAPEQDIAAITEYLIQMTEAHGVPATPPNADATAIDWSTQPY